jgi:hypothetical protein
VEGADDTASRKLREPAANTMHTFIQIPSAAYTEPAAIDGRDMHGTALDKKTAGQLQAFP